MSIKKAMLVVLVASAGMLAVGREPTRALPPAEADLPVQGFNAASAGGGPIGYSFTIIDESETEVNPAVAYSSDREEYLVVWYNDRPGNDDIRAQRVSKDGTLVGGAFYISAGSGADRRYPDVAYNSKNNQYLVVWEHYESASGYSIHARRVSGTGQVLDSMDIVVRGPGYNLYTPAEPAVAYAYTSDKYLVVWQETWHPTPISKNIEGQVVSSSGSLESSATISQDTGNGDYRDEPDVAYNRSRNEYLVVWQQRDHTVNEYDIYARRVQGNGTPMSPASIAIDTDPADQLNPAAAAIPTEPNKGYYLVVYEDHTNAGDADIYARKVKGEGTTDGNLFHISRPNEDQSHPAVAGNESNQQYLVAWTHEDYSPPFIFDGIVGRAVSIDGTLLNDETALGGIDADNAAIASGPTGDFLVAFDDQPLLASSRGIYGQLWGNRVYLPLALRNHQ